MAIKAFLRIKSPKLGWLKGPVRIGNDDNFNEIFAVNHQLISPRDSASGQASGRRQHKPMVFTKETDAISPQLYSMLVENHEVEAHIHFVNEPLTGRLIGTKTSFYAILLHKGAIVDIQLNMQYEREGNGMPALSETISIVYQSIDWKWENGKVAAHDTFSSSQ